MVSITQRILSEEVLEKTMNLFWEKGYFNTSVEDIVGAAGFNRAAIYNHFGGKEGLFLAMLKRYHSQVTDQLTAPLQNKSLGLEGIKTFFTQFIYLYGFDAKMSRGCFLVATASDLPSHNEEVATFINDFLEDIRQLFYNLLQQARKDKTVKAGINTRVVADFLVGNVYGLMTFCRSFAPKAVFQNHVRGIMEYLSTITTQK